MPSALRMALIHPANPVASSPECLKVCIGAVRLDMQNSAFEQSRLGVWSSAFVQAGWMCGVLCGNRQAKCTKLPENRPGREGGVRY